MSIVRVVTNSERSSFACQRKWWFSYIEGLTTSLSPAPLRQGSLVHHLLATWYSSDMTMSVKRLTKDIADPWLEQRNDWAVVALADYPDRMADVMAEDEEIRAMSIEMLRGYMSRWMSANRKHLEIIAVEPQLARWLRHPKTGKAIYDRPLIKGKRVRRRWAYGGAIDLIVRDKRDGRFWFVEHKTTGDKDLQKYMNVLHFSPQVRGYPWALQDPIPELSDIKEPMEVAGVIYNVLRKKVPATPHLIKDKTRLSKDKSIDTSHDVYMKAIIDNGFNPDDYADLLEKLKRNQFFAREPYPLTKRELADFETDMTHHALMIRDASKLNVFHPRQTQVCRGGVRPMKCPFEDICVEDGNMARAPYRVKTIRHEELRDELAEPYVSRERGLDIFNDGSQQSRFRAGRDKVKGAESDPFEALEY